MFDSPESSPVQSGLGIMGSGMIGVNLVSQNRQSSCNVWKK